MTKTTIDGRNYVLLDGIPPLDRMSRKLVTWHDLFRSNGAPVKSKYNRIDLDRNILSTCDCFDIASHDCFGLGQLSSGVFSTGGITGVQGNFMTLVDGP